MSLKLLRVELRNIRSHEHLIYEPGAEGVSVIQGANGTGKSTIIDSVAWAIYGTKPSGVKKQSLIVRDGVNLKAEGTKVHAIVDMEVDSQHIRVERRIMSAIASEADVWEVTAAADVDEELKALVLSENKTDAQKEATQQLSISEHGELLRHQTGPSVSSAKNYLVKRLRMDEKGFLAAVMVQQKEVDSLILAPAPERAKVIEKLTGISALTQALDIASKEHNDLKKHAANSSADEDGIKVSEKELAKLQKEKEQLETRVEKLETRFKKKQVEARDLRDKLVEQEESYTTSQTLNTELTGLRGRIESSEEELESLNEDRKAKREQLSHTSGNVSVDDIEADHADVSKRLRNAQNDVDTAHKNANTAQERITALEELIADHKPATVSENLREKTRENAAVADKEQKLQVAINSREQENTKTQKAIDVLQKGHGSCPTCLQEVDDVTDVVSNLEQQIAGNTKQNTQDNKTLDELSETAKTLTEDINTLSKIAEAFGEVEQERAALKTYNAEHAQAGSDVKILEKEFKNSERKVYNARRSAETKREYDRLLDRSKKVSDTVETAKRRVETIEEELKQLKTVSADQLETRREKFAKAKEVLADIKNDITEKKGELNVADEREQYLTKDITRLQEELKRHRELLQSVELAASSRRLVEDFRTARIESAIPVVEVYASDLLSSFTDGYFVGIELDAKFNASVKLSNGAVRPVGLLSGGELSAAAIALRLAVSMMLTGGSSSQLIILDEVLVSQDFSRAEKILGTVKDVSKGQVVMIAHSEIVESVADYTFDMDEVVASRNGDAVE